MHTHNGDPFSLFANLMPVHVHNLQTYDNLVSMHIIIYKEIKLFQFNLLFIHNINCSKCYILYI